MKHTPTYRLLLQSLDGPLPPEDQQRLTQALEESPDLAQARGVLMAQRTALRAAGETATFGPFFAGKVMRRLQETAEAVPDALTALMFAFRRVSLPALAMVILAILLVLSSESSLSWDALTGLEAITAADVWSDVTVTL